MRTLLVLLALCTLTSCFADDTIRSRAVVDLSLDSNDTIADTRGKHPDTAVVKGKPQLIQSPFWNQKGKALILDPGSQQYIEVPDSVDVDCPTGVTVSTFFLSLHPMSEGGPFHGIFAKRGDNGDSRTNYGINYLPASDSFQVYIHDGPGFKVAGYSVAATVGFSKLVHLTTTFEVADAPGADADTDADDVRVRLFINGQIVKPNRASAGLIDGNDAWLTNVDTKKFVNDVPLTIGSSFGTNELTAGVYDEFLVFNNALTPEDIAKLFVELTGATAKQIAKQEQQNKNRVAARPVVKLVTPRGLQTGAKTRLTISGATLKDAEVLLGDGFGEATVIETTGNKVVVDVSLPQGFRPGFYPLRVHNKSGISEPVVVAIDRLPEFLPSGTSAEKPAMLPAAFSGTMGGTQEVRIWFAGKKGQRIVADVESRRLSGAMDPVVEIKNSRGTPLRVEWRKHELHGDTRAEVKLPADGTYYVELHDLSYRAPGNSPFRVRVGDLKVIDHFMAVRSGDKTVLSASGIGLKPGLRVNATKQGAFGTDLANLPELDGPLPALMRRDAIEIREAEKGKQPEIDGTFAGDKAQSIVAINGVVSAAREADNFQLKVVEGTKLHFTLGSRSLGSPLDGTLRVFNGKQLLGAKDSGGTANDVAFDVTVPKGVKVLTARVSDFAHSGSPTHAYRLLVSKSGRSDFRIATQSGTVEIPEAGSVLLRLTVTRSGGGFAYAGPIRLMVEGDSGIQITPSELPEESASRDVFVVLTRSGPSSNQISPITIVAEATRGPAVRRAVQVPTTTPVLAAEYQRIMTAGTATALDGSLNIAGVPPVLFRGVQAMLPVQITARSNVDVGTVRFRLMSTERARDKKQPIRAVLNQFVSPGQSATDVKITVPFDQVDPVIDVVVVGEVVDNPFSPVAKSTLYSAPIRMLVRNAVRVNVDAKSLGLKIGTTPAVVGKVIRQFGFGQPVKVSITGLPKGYSAAAVQVEGDQSAFSIPMTLAKDAKPGDLKNVQLVVQSVSGATITANQPLAMKITK